MWFVISILARVKYARNIFTSGLACTHAHVRDACDRHLECSLPPPFQFAHLPENPDRRWGEQIQLRMQSLLSRGGRRGRIIAS